MLDSSLISEDWFEGVEIDHLMSEYMKNGIIKPLTRTVFSTDELELAFRFMAAGKHIGKVLIKMKDEDPDIHSKPEPCYLLAKPRVLCKSDASYVIIGGLGGFGLELADWLILRGARNIVLSSRNGIQKGYQSYRIKIWKSYGVNVIVNKDDVTTEDGTKKLLQAANELGPVDAIFNVAVVLQDDPFELQTEERFRISANPKEIATYHLDRLSRKMCPHLNYFVVFSSVTCGRGNMNQTNYGMTNSVMERICEARVEDNLPGLAVEWGAIGEVGVVADMAENNMNIVIGGTLQQKVCSCLEVLNDFMKQPNPIVSSIVVAEKRRMGTNIIQTIANILGIKDLKTISLNWTLPELGLDSMSGVEVKQILDAEFETFFTVEDIKSLTFAKLYKMVEEKDKNPGGSINKKNTSVVNFAPIIRIPSLADNGSTTEVPADTNPTIFHFPGMEGVTSRGDKFGLNLNVQVLCLQYCCDGFSGTLKQIARYYASLISDRISSTRKFYISSYSLGTLIAMETVKILEKESHSGHLWLIDGSIEYFENMFETSSNVSDSDHQMNAIKKLIPSFMKSKVDNKFISRLLEMNDWNERKKYTISLLSAYGGIDVAEHHFDTMYKIVKMMVDYQYEAEELKTKATLIRIKEDTHHNLGMDYGLTKYFEHPIEIHLIDSKHETILSENRTAEIISDTLKNAGI